jgi:hypothetical protein
MKNMLWRQCERIGIGLLALMPFLLIYWLFKDFIPFEDGIDGIFDWVSMLLLGRKLSIVGFVILIFLAWSIGFLLGIPYAGPFLTVILKKIPFVGAFIQHREAFANIKKIWEKSGCGPMFISLYLDGALHPAAITQVFLTDYGYLAVVVIPSFPPQELYYFGDKILYYGLSASEVSAIHVSLGFGAKRTDLRGVFKSATIKEFIDRYGLYQPKSEIRKTKSQLS